MKKMSSVLLTSLLAVASIPAFAAAPDISSLTSAVDLSTVITGVLAIAATMAGVYIAWKAAKMIIAALRGL